LQARTIDRVGALTSRTQASEKPPAFPAAALDNAKPVARNAPASGKRNKELEHD
jgi:hypothetical protein